jgi:serine/threonine-protein kinase
MEVRKFGKYEVRAMIGRGAVGTVFEAWDPFISRTVAIKTLPLIDTGDEGKELYERFKREAQAAGRLHHPSIVSAYDYGETSSSAYIVMEHLSGPSLKALLAKREPLRLTDISRIMHSVLAGLQHSHERGVVHRDIKPGNIVFAASGDVKITDFGIAHLESSGMTRAGSVLGTPAYMAPEQVLGEAVDARTDIYSAGVVFYELLTGRRPFEGSEASIMHKIVHMEAPRPSQLAPTISPGFDAIIAQAIAKNPADRYQSASEFDAALRDALERTPALPDESGASDGCDVTVQTQLPPAPAEMPLIPNEAPPPTLAPEPVTPSPTLGLRRRKAGDRSRLLLIGGAGAVVLGLGATTWLALSPGPPRKAFQPQPAAVSPSADVAAVAAPPSAAPAPAPPQPAMQPAAGFPAGQQATSPPPIQSAGGLAEPFRQQVEAIVTSAPCSVISSDMTHDGQLRLSGVSALGDASELEIRATLQRAIQMTAPGTLVTWSIHRIDGPYCPVLDLLRPLAKATGNSGLSLSLPANQSRLPDGAPVRVAVAMTGVPARLTLDSFSGDGAVHHLHAGLTEDSHLYVEGAWKAGKPYGEQLIIALVTSQTLFAQERPAHEAAAAYLKDLRSALAQVRDHDARLTVGALSIDVVPR